MTAERDALIERAALIEEGCGVSRAEAEKRAAQMQGYRDWAEAMEKTR